MKTTVANPEPDRFPESVKHKSNLATIYRTKNREVHRYEVRWHDDQGKRQRETFLGYDEAKAHALAIVKRVAYGGADLLTLRGHERFVYERAVGALRPYRLELDRVYEDAPEGAAAATTTIQWVMRGRGNTCPVCNSTYTKGDILTLLRSGAASSNSVLATHHLDKLPVKERKLLVFADNRQEAAHQAGYMGDRHRQFAVRHAIEQVVRDAGASGLALNIIAHKLLEKFQDMGLARRKLSLEEQRFWRKALEFEAAGEFCRATHQRISLENLALVEVQYEFLDQLAKDNRFKEACEHVGLKLNDAATLIRAILDLMRRHRAVAFDFYQRYLDPTREPWSILASEPYSVGIGEHERTAQYFMMDRPEAARSASVSGCKFNPLVEDSDRGGLGGIMRLVVKKAHVSDVQAEAWVRTLVDLLREYEILEPASILPASVRRAIGGRVPLQIASRVIRLFSATSAFRGAKCQIWRPYQGLACYATSRCSGVADDLKPSTVNTDG